MRLIVLKNGNAINVDKIKQFMIEDDCKICVDINGEGIPVCIYNIGVSFEYNNFHNETSWDDPVGFVYKVSRLLYRELDNYNFNLDIRSLEQAVIWNLKEELSGKKENI